MNFKKMGTKNRFITLILGGLELVIGCGVMLLLGVANVYGGLK